MAAKKPIWRPHPLNPAQELSQGERDRVAFFGYRQIPEREKVHWVMRHFNTIAPRYDFMNTLLSFGIHYLWKRRAVKMLQLKPGDRVIDVCGGTGDLSVLAARVVGAKGRVILYDINRAMMEKGRLKVLRSPRGGPIVYVQGNAEQISFADQEFDAAMIGFGIRNLTHMEEGLREIYRVLKPSGRLMCLEFSKPTPPLFRWLYDLYSFYIMPYLGQFIVGSRQAYTYLPESIRLFPLPDEFKAILEGIGFIQVTYRKLTHGIAVIHMGQKG